MSEMIKRVALALFAESEGISPIPEEWPAETGDTLKRFWGCYANAAIEAMKEPTDKMNLSGQLIGDYPWDGLKATRIFRAMIDEALK